MKRFTPLGFTLAALVLASCAEGGNATIETKTIGLIGDWQSLEDPSYVLKFNTETYREFYDDEEMSRDQWQAVKSCEDPQPMAKTNEIYGGFQIWTKETDDRICYAISKWTADSVSLTYAGTTSSYRRAD